MSEAPPREDEPPGPARPGGATALSEAIGGTRGLIDSGLAAVVFVAVNALAGLRAGIAAAVVVGLLLVVLRLVRHEPLRQALGGFVGLALAAGFAAYTHSAVGFFLPGIIYQGVLAVAAVVSLAIGRPYVGYVAATVDDRLTGWREDPSLRRAMSVATVLWAAVFAVRTVVQGYLYLHRNAGWLAASKLAMGWPLFAGGLALTYAIIRRAAAHLTEEQEAEPGDAVAVSVDEAPGTRAP